VSYVALATDRFDEVVAFYRDRLGFPIVDCWDRPDARGLRLDIGGMRLEILDNGRESHPLTLGQPADRFHVVIEVDDVDFTWATIDVDAREPETTSWGARIFQLRDPDGVPVTFLQWLQPCAEKPERLRGRVSSGTGQGRHFTGLGWARAQFIEKLGIDPFPGTLNLIIDNPDSKAAWEALNSEPGIRIVNPGGGPNDCDGRCYPVFVDGQAAAIVVPEVDGYPDDKVEIIAPSGLREALGMIDGDEITVDIRQSESPPSVKRGERTA